MMVSVEAWAEQLHIAQEAQVLDACASELLSGWLAISDSRETLVSAIKRPAFVEALIDLISAGYIQNDIDLQTNVLSSAPSSSQQNSHSEQEDSAQQNPVNAQYQLDKSAQTLTMSLLSGVESNLLHAIDDAMAQALEQINDNRSSGNDNESQKEMNNTLPMMLTLLACDIMAFACSQVQPRTDQLSAGNRASSAVNASESVNSPEMSSLESRNVLLRLVDELLALFSRGRELALIVLETTDIPQTLLRLPPDTLQTHQQMLLESILIATEDIREEGKQQQSANPSDIAEAEREIHEILPQFPAPFLRACLEFFNNDKDVTVARLLANDLPRHLMQLRRELQTKERGKEAEQASEGSSRRAQKIGKTAQTAQSNELEPLSDQIRMKILEYQQKLAEDEEDDSYDTVDVAPVTGSETDLEDNNEGKQKQQRDLALFVMYQSNKSVFERSARQSNERRELVEQTGFSHEQIEGWASMLSRHPNLVRKYEDMLLEAGNLNRSPISQIASSSNQNTVKTGLRKDRKFKR